MLYSWNIDHSGSGSNRNERVFHTPKMSRTAIYLTSNRVRIWHKAVLWWGPNTNQDTCVVGAKILDPIDILPLGHLRHQAINLVQEASKVLERWPLRPRCHSTQTTAYNGWQAAAQKSVLEPYYWLHFSVQNPRERTFLHMFNKS